MRSGAEGPAAGFREELDHQARLVPVAEREEVGPRLRPALLQREVELRVAAEEDEADLARAELELRKDARTRMENIMRGIAWEYGK